MRVGGQLLLVVEHFGRAIGAMHFDSAKLRVYQPDQLDAVGQVFIHLGVDFISSARLGDIVQCRTEVLRQTRSLFFMRGTIVVGERCIATANGGY